MILVSIAVEPPPEAAAAAALERSCSAVLAPGGDGACRVARGDEPAASHRVRVKTDRDLTSADVELRGAPGQPARSSQLKFESDFPIDDRWGSVGLLIAALVMTEEPKGAAPETPAARPRDARWMLGTAGKVGSGVEPSHVLFGGELGLARRGESRWLPLVALTMAHGSSSVDQSLLLGSAGVAYDFVREPLVLSLRVEAAWQALLLRTRERDPEEQDLVHRFGGLAALELGVPLHDELLLRVFGQGSGLWPRVELELDGELVARGAPFGWFGGVGLWAAL